MCWGILGRKGVHLPQPEGPYVPGCLDISTEYDPKNESSGAPGLYRLYYPTDLPKTQDHSAYWPKWVPDDKYIEGIAAVVGIWTWVVRFIIFLLAGEVHIPAVWEAPVRRKESPLPVIVLSHGLGGSRVFYTTTCVELASHGFLVVAIEHGDGSACATYRKRPQCQWIPYQKMPKDSSKHAGLRESQIEKRTSECRSAILFLNKLNAGTIPADSADLDGFREHLDLSSLTLMGHSFGAATALNTLANEPRFVRGIVLDAWMYPINKQKDTLPSRITQPLIFINTQTFHIEKNLVALRRYIKNHPVYTIRGTTHEHQTDTPHLLGSWLSRGFKKIDYKIATKINNQLILSWLSDRTGHGQAETQFLASQSENIIEDLVLGTEKFDK